MRNFSLLTKHLRVQPARQVRMSFAEIEGVVGGKLPNSAEAYRAWWSNNPSNNPMTKAWLEAGFKSEQVDLPGRKVVFTRASPTQAVPPQGATEDSEPPSSLPALFGWMRGTVTIDLAVDLTAPADPAWGLRVDAE